MGTKPKIVLDPGHGGSDRANVGPTGYVEADGVLDIGLRLRDLLKNNFDILMTRETDKTVSLKERSSVANAWRADAYISLHTNAASNPSAGGIETFYTYNNAWSNAEHREKAAKLAALVQEELVDTIDLRDRGIKTCLNSESKDYYSVIRNTNAPAIIIENGFHSNPQEEGLLKTPEFRQIIAEGICIGIKKYFNLTSNMITADVAPFTVEIDGGERTVLEVRTMIEKILPACGVHGIITEVNIHDGKGYFMVQINGQKLKFTLGKKEIELYGINT